MNREQSEQLLAAYLTDELDAATRAEVDAELAADAALRDRLADMRMSLKLMHQGLEEEAQPQLSQARRLALLAAVAQTAVSPAEVRGKEAVAWWRRPLRFAFPRKKARPQASQPSRWRGRPLLPSMIAFAAAILLIAGVALVLTPPPGRRVTSVPPLAIDVPDAVYSEVPGERISPPGGRISVSNGGYSGGGYSQRRSNFGITKEEASGSKAVADARQVPHYDFVGRAISGHPGDVKPSGAAGEVRGGPGKVPVSGGRLVTGDGRRVATYDTPSKRETGSLEGSPPAGKPSNHTTDGEVMLYRAGNAASLYSTDGTSGYSIGGKTGTAQAGLPSPAADGIARNVQTHGKDDLSTHDFLRNITAGVEAGRELDRKSDVQSERERTQRFALAGDRMTPDAESPESPRWSPAPPAGESAVGKHPPLDSGRTEVIGIGGGSGAPRGAALAPAAGPKKELQGKPGGIKVPVGGGETVFSEERSVTKDEPAVRVDGDDAGVTSSLGGIEEAKALKAKLTDPLAPNSNAASPAKPASGDKIETQNSPESIAANNYRARAVLDADAQAEESFRKTYGHGIATPPAPAAGPAKVAGETARPKLEFVGGAVDQALVETPPKKDQSRETAGQQTLTDGSWVRSVVIAGNALPADPAKPGLPDVNRVDGVDKGDGWMASARPTSQPAMKHGHDKRTGSMQGGGGTDVAGQQILPPASTFRDAPVNPWVMTDRDRFSTFASDVDTASYTLCRSYLRAGFLPPRGAVRMEEFVNAFDYNYPRQAPGVFNVFVEGGPNPFAQPGENTVLLKIGVQGRVIGREGRKSAHLVFVVDTSGSMARPDRLPLVQDAVRMLADALSPDDRVTLITFNRQASLVLECVPASRKSEILAASDSMRAGGPTNLLAGLQAGYKLAQREFLAGRINRVILCTDGAANIGQTDSQAIQDGVAAFRRQGITLTVAGFGRGGYNAELLETLAKKGDGSYLFIDTPQQARESLVEKMDASLQTIAFDSRIQVEFNPDRVRRYRLIGYEKRQIAAEDFRNDAVEAAEVGSGQSATALYELELTEGDPRGGAAASPAAPDGVLATVYVRYRNADSRQMEEISRRVEARNIRPMSVEENPRFFLAAAAGRFAEILRQSPHVKNGNLAQVERLLQHVCQALPLDDKAGELLQLVGRAKNLPRSP
jgi:Ca-activated chloride channel family protein